MALLRRRDLKPKQRLSDKALLAAAAQRAAEWDRKKKGLRMNERASG